MPHRTPGSGGKRGEFAMYAERWLVIPLERERSTSDEVAVAQGPPPRAAGPTQRTARGIRALYQGIARPSRGLLSEAVKQAA
jgi:hypothetical protein